MKLSMIAAKVSKVFLTFLLPLFFSNAMAVDLQIPEDKEIIRFETKLGIVTFAHKNHAGLSITICSTCHHKIAPGDTVVKPCHEFHHHKSKDVLKTSKALHARCKGCHEYTAAGGQKAGPLKQKCRLCHIKPLAD